MNPRFTRGEYWLLTLVVEAVEPLRILLHENACEALNVHEHGVEKEVLIDDLERLFSDGLVEAHGEAWPGPVSPSREQLVEALNEKGSGTWGPPHYALSAKGGEQWEAFSRPSWDHYLTAFGSLEAESEWELVCPSRWILERYLENMSPDAREDLDDSSIQWDVLVPWEATYWKELPLGHRLRFRAPDRRDDEKWTMAMKEDVRGWTVRYRYGVYRLWRQWL